MAELEALAIRLMFEFEPRFAAADMDLSIGCMQWFFDRGIGLEINGEWNSFKAARRHVVRRKWTVLLDLQGLEDTVRAYLEAQLRLFPQGRKTS